MAWLHRWEIDSAPPLVRADGVPRLLRHLVSSCGLRIGGRVLEIGATSFRLAPVFRELGIETVELSPTHARVGDDGFIPFQNVTESESESESGFDLVLVHATHPGLPNLRAQAAVTAVRNWIDRLNPSGGTLTLLAERDTDGRPRGHALSCCRSLLARFSGTIDCTEISSGTLWQRLRGDVVGEGWFVTTLHSTAGNHVPVVDLRADDDSTSGSCCTRASLRDATRERTAA